MLRKELSNNDKETGCSLIPGRKVQEAKLTPLASSLQIRYIPYTLLSFKKLWRGNYLTSLTATLSHPRAGIECPRR